jgi:phosphoribosylformimino-5-aminoimidazole carboxamide ribotide isomerase
MIISSISRITGCMDIIPVIDLKGGHVVRAQMGQRDQYRPIVTPLSPTSDPVDVTRGLLSVFPFRTLYVADLDAIERTGNSNAVLARLRNTFPELSFWVDNGIAEANAAEQFLTSTHGHLVLGSEAQRDASLVASLKDDPHVILSLDFRGDAFIGPPSLLETPANWPQRVIVMTLARVGSGAGPDIARLREIRALAANAALYAAGGLRNPNDLAVLKREGIAGALVASSLHAGELTRTDLERL